MSAPKPSIPVVLAAMVLSMLAYAGGLLAMMLTNGALSRRFELRYVLIGSEAALAIPSVFVMALFAATLPELVRFRPLNRLAIPTTMLLGLGLWTLSLGVFEAQYVLVRPPLEYLEQFQGLHELLRPKSPLGWVFSIGAIAIAPAICEELVFRGLLTPVLRAAVGSAGAILASAFFFAVIHIDTLPGRSGLDAMVFYRVPFAFVLGMLLAKIRIDTGSLWPPMIAHATLNATTFIVVFLAPEEKGVLPEANPAAAIGMLLFGCLASAMLLRRVRAAEPNPGA